jgi:serine/threonine protein kinase
MRPTDSGVVKGKLQYMAPEQARGERVDARADVFACGVILWESVVGKRLWAGKNDPAIMYALHSGDIPRPRDVSPDVPEALEAICRRALAINPAERFPSAVALRDAIEGYLETLPGRPTRRAIGERVVTLFEDERSQIRQIVEDQLGRVKNASTDEFAAAGMPSVKMPRIADSSVSGLTDATKTDTTKATTTLSTSPPPASKRSLVLVAVVLLALASTALSLFVFLRSQRPVVNAAPAPSVTTSVQPAVQSAVPSDHPTASEVIALPPPTSASASARPATIHTGTGRPPPLPTASPTDVGY